MAIGFCSTANPRVEETLERSDSRHAKRMTDRHAPDMGDWMTYRIVLAVIMYTVLAFAILYLWRTGFFTGIERD